MPKELSKRAKGSHFVSIASSSDTLFALDNNGRVWRYFPAKRLGPADPVPSTKAGDHGYKYFAFWGSLTTHRAPPDDGTNVPAK